MLNTIRDLVRDVTIIVIIAGFLEMLLPSGEIKKFVKAVMGLFILVSILNPLLSLFDKNVACEVLAWQNPAPNTELTSILHQGEEISRHMNDKAVDLYTKNLAKQIEMIVKLVKGVTWVQAMVEMEKTGNPDYGKISKVVLEVGTGSKNGAETDLEKVEPIDINISGEKRTAPESPDHEQMKVQIKEALKSFYSLNEEQIQITMMSQSEEETDGE
ncbi:stage III sporulation protein AF [Candidatus Formimonas warabiya]|uniref:Stage III sporulation protein AF n=1 Tax=Formimonas warabiya TaxID=1761012 RepID=A0A3G1KNJ7_FORW1|nr:stage III sporulation protein AF [Candidatus Formimonas warabiya]ATW24027.1 stage III sporulation protein AF [Candidatus Formimonas warabiya]